MTTTVALVGGHGYGALHLERILGAQADGLVRLVGIADPVPVDDARISADVRQVASLAELLGGGVLGGGGLDIVIVSTPIPTHAPLAALALEAGADVLLEKPPTASLAEFDALRAQVERLGRRCQVGFQSLGSAALPAARARIAEGAIGPVTGYSASATWARSEQYFRRSAWAGRRHDDHGGVVADGALTNPLAHAVATLLSLAGAGGRAGVIDVDVELYRANDIESDDTSFARLRLDGGVDAVVAVTLAAAEQTLPVVSVVGERGRIDFYYTIDVLIEHRDGIPVPRATRFDRVDLLRDLVRVRQEGGELLSPLHAAAGFMRVLEAVVTAPEPVVIAPAHVERRRRDGADFRVVADVERWIARAATERAGFREIGAPWTH